MSIANDILNIYKTINSEIDECNKKLVDKGGEQASTLYDIGASIGDIVIGGDNSILTAFIDRSVTEIPLECLRSLDGIRSYAFADCSSLQSVTIGDSVTSIGYEAFSNCNSITDIYIYSIIPPALLYADEFTNTNAILHVPAGSLSEYQTATNWAIYASRMVGDL